MLRLEGMNRQTGETYVDPLCNAETNERGLRLLEFATCNSPLLTNTLGHTNHPEGGYGTAQTRSITTRLITLAEEAISIRS